MARQLLTDAKCSRERLPAEKGNEKLVSDGDGLFLRLRRVPGENARVTKTWLYVFTLNGKRGKQGLGVYPQVSLARARELASSSREAVARGSDPVAVREAEERATAARDAAAQARPTVLGLFEQWHDAEASKRKDGGAEIRRAVEKDVLPLLGKMFADEVRRRDVTRVLDEVKKRGVRRYVNYLLQYLRSMFTYAIVREIVTIDPTYGIRRKDAGGKHKPRDRVLKEDEIHDLGRKLGSAGLSASAQAAFWFVLATCCRVGELTKARWSEFDKKVGTWLIPAEHAKNGTEHLVHLSPFALKQLAILKQNATSKIWLFPAAEGAGHGDPKSLQKMFRDRQRTIQIRGRSKKLGVLALKSGRWTVHDLRRTAATMMGELGVRPDIIERALAHKPADELRETYQRQETPALRKEAFGLLGERLELLARERPGNVVAGSFGTQAA